MSDQGADLVVVGTTPLARLLAGLLAGAHGRRVLLVGEGRSAYRLARAIDLSITPMTRPQSWALVQDGLPEVLKLLAHIAGRTVWSHVDPVFFADDAPAAEALSHMRHMALDFGIAAEQTPPSLLGAGRAGVTFRDAITLNTRLMEPALQSWLVQSGVRSLMPNRLDIADDGSAILHADGQEFYARQTILADDDAILTHLPQSAWPYLLSRQPAAAILTRLAHPLTAPIMVDVHSGLTMAKQPEGGIIAMGLGDIARVSEQVQHLADQKTQIEHSGQIAFTALMTMDGAPALGRIGGIGPDVIVGMGLAGAFMAPALARWLCGEASASEADWFGARLVSRAAEHSVVAEYAPYSRRISA